MRSIGPPPHASKASNNARRAGGVDFNKATAVKPWPLDWLIPDYWPLGKILLLAGDGGHGKSMLTLDVAACLSAGRPCLGLKYDSPPPCDVMIVSCEDDWEDTVIPRLIAARADRDRILRVNGTKTADGKVVPFSLADCEALDVELARQKHVRFVVIDPAGAYIGRCGIDDHKDSELRAQLGPLAEVAARRCVTFALVKHLIKGLTLRAVHKVGGSAGYVNAVRAAFLLTPDAADPALKLLLPLKYNLGEKPGGRSFRFEGLPKDEQEALLEPFPDLRPDDRRRLGQQLVRLRWEGAVAVDADDALAATDRRERGPGRVDACADWLKTFLAGFAYPSEEIVTAAQAAGFTFSNVKDAKIRLKPEGLRNTKEGFQGEWWSGFGDPSTWTLRPAGPKGAPPPATTGHVRAFGAFGAFEPNKGVSPKGSKESPQRVQGGNDEKPPAPTKGSKGSKESGGGGPDGPAPPADEEEF
jgi:hypothetical protein